MAIGHMCNAPDLEGLPESERPILERALAKRPEDRWPDCRSFIDALKALGSAGERSIPDALPRDRRGLSPAPDGPGESTTLGLDPADADFIPVDSGEFESPRNGIKFNGPLPAFWCGSYGFGLVSRVGTGILDHLSRYGHELKDRLVVGWPTRAVAGRRSAEGNAAGRGWSARLEQVRALTAMRLDRLRQMGRRAAHWAAARPGWLHLGSIAVLVVSVLVLWNLVWTSPAQRRPAGSSDEVAVAGTASNHPPDAAASGSRETGITPGPTLEPSIVAAGPEAPVTPPAPAVPEKTSRAPVDLPRPKESVPTGRIVATKPKDATPTTEVVAAKPKESTPTGRDVAVTRPSAPAGTIPIGSGLKSTLAWLQESDFVHPVSTAASPSPRRAEANKESVGDAPLGSSASNAGRRPPDRLVAPRLVTPAIALPVEVKVTPGTTTKVHVRVQRCDVAEPVQLDLRGLPRGITAAGLTIPAGKDWTDVVLASSTEPPPGIAEVKVAFTAGSERGEAATRIEILPSPPATVAYKRGLAAFGVGSSDQAIADFSEAIRLDPNSSGARFYRGVVQALTGRSQEALADYTAAIQLQPDRPEAYLERAKIYIGLGAETLALNDFNAAIRLRPDADAYLARAGLHHEMGTYDEALADCDRALRLRPGDPVAFFLRGLTRYHSGDYAGAVADLTEVIRRDPKDARAYRLRGDAHARLGKRASAEADHGVFERLNRPAAEGAPEKPEGPAGEGGPGAGRGQSP
jgi:Tfp pilus assembly protein PilF